MANRTIPCIDTPTRYSDTRFDELPFVAPVRKDVIMVGSTKTQIKDGIRHSRAVLTVAARCGVTIFALSAGFLAACGQEGAPSVTPDVLEVDGNSGDSGDVGLNLPSCVDNLDCSGGEVCRDGLCREACLSDVDCSASRGVCDGSTGICVSCLQNTDCGDNATCEGTECVFFCESDDACSAEQFCDEATGACQTRECSAPTDCRGGFDCRDFRCVPLEPIICEPGDTRCSDAADGVITCGRDGTEELEAPCGSEQLCVEEAGDASCVDVLCAPFEIGCSSAQTAFACDELGVSRTEFDCGEARYCDAGVCKPQVCEADTVVCDGNLVVTCDALGAQATVLACTETDACRESAAGCVCVDGVCEERVCTPGTGRCVGAAAQSCSADGLGYEDPVTCDADELCVAGACLERRCTAGTRECVGETLVVCSADGTNRTETDCAASDQLCTATGAGAACSPRVCEPDSVGCEVDGATVLTCDARGAVLTAATCASGTYCNGGACLDQLCAPGTGNTCVGGDVQRCNGDGSAWVLVTDCNAATQRCVGGACANIVCTAGETRCSGDTLVVCASDGLSETRTNCASSASYCDPGARACAPRICTPGSSRCRGNDVVLCDVRGAGETTTSTCSATLGCSAGACVVGCADGIVQSGEQCDDGNRTASDGCGADCQREVVDGYVVIPAGTFTMGAPFVDELGARFDELPHTVTLTRPYLMKVTEVTQGEWRAISGGTNPSCFQQTTGINCTTVNANDQGPVDWVDWYSALGFANALSLARGLEACYTLTGC
ncbi:MAG: SUMF1/EgtB/PvdO family nonheme iron enzyme, partial [Myxococcales bacterium]|nr:SUMF1/EgtB/PvdO family nonheme iron enzyme [Myxococcales bacterium]